MKGNVRTKKKWFEGEIGKDLPITIAMVMAEITIFCGIYAEILLVYR